MRNEIIKRNSTSISEYLNSDGAQRSIDNVIAESDKQRFIAGIVSAVQALPDLKECTNVSILSAALLGESLKLAPSPQLGYFYMIPYKNTKAGTTEAQFQIGYRGYIQLALRSKQYRKIVVTEIKEGEIELCNPLTEDYKFKMISDTSQRQEAPTIGYYGMFELLSGFRKEIFWTKEQMEEHAETYSSGYKRDIQKKTAYTFWSKNFDAMAKKTLIRQLISKWGIMSVDMQRAYEMDMASIEDDGNYTYIDNQKDLKADVEADIAENANSIQFEDAEIIESQATLPPELGDPDDPPFL